MVEILRYAMATSGMAFWYKTTLGYDDYFYYLTDLGGNHTTKVCSIYLQFYPQIRWIGTTTCCNIITDEQKSILRTYDVDNNGYLSLQEYTNISNDYFAGRNGITKALAQAAENAHIFQCYIGTGSPPPDKYYACVNGVCTLSTGTTGYKNDPSCGGTCNPPVQDKYYTCVNGVCTLSTGTTGYLNDNTCGGHCTTTTTTSSDNSVAILAAAAVAIAYLVFRKKGR